MVAQAEKRKQFLLAGGWSCQGCGSMLSTRLALNAVYGAAPDALVYGYCCPAQAELSAGRGNQVGLESAFIEGVAAALKYRGAEDRPIVYLGGEGRLYDMGFDVFTGSFGRQVPVTYIILDNESYSESGSHSTSTTLWKTRTPLHLRGLPKEGKVPQLMMLFGGAKYVATASVAYPKDLKEKVEQAMVLKPSIVQVFAPCVTGWGYTPSQTLNLGRLAVETGVFSLWQYKEGVFERTLRFEEKKPLREYLSKQRRYRGITPQDIKELEDYVKEQEQLLDSLERGFARDLVRVER